MAKIPFLEVFGPTIQGEGMVIGKRLCSFVLMVVTMVAFGDTAYTWDGSEKVMYDAQHKNYLIY